MPGSERAVLDWIRAHAGPQTTILSICAGSRVLVETGLLDGHAATGLHQDLARFKERYPAVRWQAGVRWVDAGQFITSGTLSAGIDATLHTIERLAGRAVAERAGQALGYPHLNRLADPAAEYQPPAAPDMGLMPTALYGWGQTNVGVVVYDGISETALAALLDTAAMNLTHSATLAPQRTFIRERSSSLAAPARGAGRSPARPRHCYPGTAPRFGSDQTHEGAKAAGKRRCALLEGLIKLSDTLQYFRGNKRSIGKLMCKMLTGDENM